MKKNEAKNIYLIAKILDSGKSGYLQLKSAEVKPTDLDQDCQKALEFIEEHVEKFNEVPSRQVFEHSFGFELPPSSGSLDFWIQEVVQEKMMLQGITAVQRFGAKVKESFKSAVDELRNFVRYSDSFSIKTHILKPKDALPAVSQRYTDAQANKIGIPTPWSEMDKWTRGWNPGDLCFVGARTGVGKTFFTILCAKIALMQEKPKVVLYASGEMTPTVIFTRFSSMCSGVSYSKIRDGKLEVEDELKYFKFLDENFRHMDALNVIDFSKKKEGFSMVNIEAAVEQISPDLLIVDAAYMLKPYLQPKNEFQVMSQIAKELKSLAVASNIPIIASTQLNRTSIQKTTYDDSDFALSDQIGWNSDFMFTLRQSQEQYQARIMEIQPVKIREGKNDRTAMSTSWCFENMDFSKRNAEVTDINEYKQTKKSSKPKPGKDDDDDYPWL